MVLQGCSRDAPLLLGNTDYLLLGAVYKIELSIFSCRGIYQSQIHQPKCFAGNLYCSFGVWKIDYCLLILTKLHMLFFNIYIKCQLLSCVRLFVTLWTVAHEAPLWNSLGKNTIVACHSLFQGIFLSQGSSPGFLHCRQILSCLSHQGSPVSAQYILILSSEHRKVVCSIKCFCYLFIIPHSRKFKKIEALFDDAEDFRKPNKKYGQTKCK